MHQCISPLAMCILLEPVGSANGSHFGCLLMIPTKRPMLRIGSSRWQILLTLSFPKIKETLSKKLLVLNYLFLHPTEKHQDPKFLLLLRNATRHHCLRCRLDPHVNVWSYLSPMMKSCQASRTIAFLAPIILPCGAQ